MSQYSFRSSQPDRWINPRPHSDPTLRRMHYGAIQPMVTRRPGILRRLFKAV
ncbi:hypothetical protein [Altererythrobacter sp. MF3-039]|uniref:hypothetical protein n=1 Tax=Altererythrobacter sp. MF3-039 TaxID=3252901 RepID=UPI00390CCA25